MQLHKVAFVTGAGSGLGLGTAEAFLRGGYATVLVDRNEAGGEEAAARLRRHGECIFIACDIADDAAVEAAIARAVSTYGRIDAAFNAAGVEGEGAKVADATQDAFNRVVAVNLAGTWHCMRHQIRQMLKQGGGAIVNCSSGAGMRGVATAAAYSASKHGVLGLTKSAALEYAGDRIRVNAVCPGMIDTPMTARALPPEYIDQVLARIPAGRMGLAEDIAAAVLWLCDERSSYVNGQAISVDGGASL